MVPTLIKMREKLFKDIFASSAQILINQAASFVIFLVTSTYLAKETYGELNWFIALFTVIMALLSFGMEPIIIKKIAIGESTKETAGLFITHVLITSFFFACIASSLFLLV